MSRSTAATESVQRRRPDRQRSRTNGGRSGYRRPALQCMLRPPWSRCTILCSAAGSLGRGRACRVRARRGQYRAEDRDKDVCGTAGVLRTSRSVRRAMRRDEPILPGLRLLLRRVRCSHPDHREDPGRDNERHPTSSGLRILSGLILGEVVNLAPNQASRRRARQAAPHTTDLPN